MVFLEVRTVALSLSHDVTVIPALKYPKDVPNLYRMLLCTHPIHVYITAAHFLNAQ